MGCAGAYDLIDYSSKAVLQIQESDSWNGYSLYANKAILSSITKGPDNLLH